MLDTKNSSVEQNHASSVKAAEEKYGNDAGATEAVEAYHRSRRMFCIYQDELVVAEAALPYSHSVWFEKEGWIAKDNDSLIMHGVRGILNSDSEVHFYTGYDFEINDEVEATFFKHLQELVDQLQLPLDTKVYGGAIKSPPGSKWPARKAYGTIEECLRR